MAVNHGEDTLAAERGNNAELSKIQGLALKGGGLALLAAIAIIVVNVAMNHQHSSSPFWQLMWSDSNTVMNGAMHAAKKTIFGNTVAHAR